MQAIQRIEIHPNQCDDPSAESDVQERIDYLAERANQGLLTDEEQDEYDGYLHAIDVIAILQAKARAQLRRQS